MRRAGSSGASAAPIDRGTNVPLVYRQSASGESVHFGSAHSRHTPARSGSVVEACLEQALRGDSAVRVLHDARELVPVDAVVQADAEPAAVADVRRAEEPRRVGLHEQLLIPRTRGAPDAEDPVTVMIVEQHQKAF